MEDNKCIVWVEGNETEYKKLVLTDDQVRLINWLDKEQDYPIQIIGNCSDDEGWERI